MAVFVVMRAVAMDMSMCIFVTGLVYMRMFMKVFMCMSVTVFVLIYHFSLPVIPFFDTMNCSKRTAES